MTSHTHTAKNNSTCATVLDVTICLHLKPNWSPMRHRIVIGIFVLIMAISLLPVSAYGVNEKNNQDLETNKQAIDDKSQKRVEKLEAKNARKCEHIKAKLETHRDKSLEIR